MTITKIIEFQEKMVKRSEKLQGPSVNLQDEQYRMKVAKSLIKKGLIKESSDGEPECMIMHSTINPYSLTDDEVRLYIILVTNV